jgi:hypothetical protein
MTSAIIFSNSSVNGYIKTFGILLRKEVRPNIQNGSLVFPFDKKQTYSIRKSGDENKTKYRQSELYRSVIE